MARNSIFYGLATGSVDQLDFPQRFKNAVLQLALVKTLFRLSPYANLNLSRHFRKVRDRAPCVVKLVAISGEAQLNDLIGGRW